MTSYDTISTPPAPRAAVSSAEVDRYDTTSLTPVRRPPISVAVADGQAVFRRGLAQLLGEDDRIDVVAVSDGGPEVADLCATLAVDVLVTDIRLPRANGIELIRLVRSTSSHTRVLVLAAAADWGVVPAMSSGASGFLLKDTDPEAITSAVVAVHLGEQVLCREATEWLNPQTVRRLTRREVDVLYMVTQGAQNSEIAEWLQVGEKTVRNYVSRLYQKLSVRDRAQIATYAAYAEEELKNRGDEMRSRISRATPRKGGRDA